MCALGLASAATGAVPEHFQPRAKELLADSIELAENAHQVNVIYFLPTDAEPVADYERRISELLLYLQQFYGKEMQRNGYGNHSFGLNRKENGNVDILLLRAKGPRTDYPYENAGKCLEEVEAYFEEHPEKKASQHTFILMPTFYNEKFNDQNPGGVPFYGIGRYCFALDYKDFDIQHIGQDTHEGHLLTKWFGGFAHELGHGLNLPHNNGPASMNKALGTPLMGAGNYTFGMTPTYMTPASCAILSNSEVFVGKGNTTQFYVRDTPPEIYFSNLERKGDTLELTLLLSPDCVQVNAYVQDPPFQINEDYDSVAFVGEMGHVKEHPQKAASEHQPAPKARTTAKVTIPLSELSELKHAREGEVELSILIQTDDGSRFRWRSLIDLSKPETIKLSQPELQNGY